MLKVIIQIRKKNGKKEQIKVHGIDSVEINQNSSGSGLGDMWLYSDKELSGSRYNCYCVKAEYKPSVVEVSQSDLEFRFTDDILNEYVV